MNEFGLFVVPLGDLEHLPSKEDAAVRMRVLEGAFGSEFLHDLAESMTPSTFVAQPIPPGQPKYPVYERDGLPF